MFQRTTKVAATHAPATTPSTATTPRAETVMTPRRRGTTMSRRMTKAAVVLAGFALAFTSAACTAERTPEGDGGGDQETAGDAGGEEETEPERGLVGIAMPTRSLERWNNDGSHLEALLQERGYETSLQYADNEVDQQITHLQNMINQGAEILVIASIDGTALAPVLEQAASAGTTVIAYDRLINESENVDYYATFDNYEV